MGNLLLSFPPPPRFFSNAPHYQSQMASNLQTRGNGEQRARRPSEKQQQLSKSHPTRLGSALAHLPSDKENISQVQRRVTEAEKRRHKEAGVIQPRPRSQNVQHEVRT
jgi:hypothetical protein